MTRNKKAIKPLKKSQQQLVEDNVGFAMNLGKKYAGLGRFKGIPMEDLQQEACIGLCIAAQKYVAPSNTHEGESGEAFASFQTFAYAWCLKFIMMAIRNKPLEVYEEHEMEDVDIVDDDDEAALAEDRLKSVEAMMAVLCKKERQVVKMLYGFDGTPMDFREVAAKMNLTVGHVHRIYEQALGKMEMGMS